ncbi:MAG: hypothetical protein EOO43_01545 [Flavobacterium sp.]|nr:MAG: hypothetical protein EOO43_01545 [Flavobacterium sp.]
MPSVFKKLNRGTNHFFQKVGRDTNHFFKKDVTHAAHVVGHGIVSTAKKVGDGLERVVKSDAFTDALAVGGVLAAPFSGGASLALESAAVGTQVARDTARKIRNSGNTAQQLINNNVQSGKHRFDQSMANANRQAQRGLAVTQSRVEKKMGRMAIQAHNNLTSLANSIPIQPSQRGMMADGDSTAMVIH